MSADGVCRSLPLQSAVNPTPVPRMAEASVAAVVSADGVCRSLPHGCLASDRLSFQGDGVATRARRTASCNHGKGRHRGGVARVTGCHFRVTVLQHVHGGRPPVITAKADTEVGWRK